MTTTTKTDTQDKLQGISDRAIREIANGMADGMPHNMEPLGTLRVYNGVDALTYSILHIEQEDENSPIRYLAERNGELWAFATQLGTGRLLGWVFVNDHFAIAADTNDFSTKVRYPAFGMPCTVCAGGDRYPNRVTRMSPSRKSIELESGSKYSRRADGRYRPVGSSASGGCTLRLGDMASSWDPSF